MLATKYRRTGVHERRRAQPGQRVAGDGRGALGRGQPADVAGVQPDRSAAAAPPRPTGPLAQMALAWLLRDATPYPAILPTPWDGTGPAASYTSICRLA